MYTDYSIEESDWLMKKEETPILEPIPSFSSCLDQARNILFPNIFLKKKEEISWSEENFHLCLPPPFRFVYFCFERKLEVL